MTALRVMSSVVIRLSTRRENDGKIFIFSRKEVFIRSIADVAEGWIVD